MARNFAGFCQRFVNECKRRDAQHDSIQRTRGGSEGPIVGGKTKWL